MTQVPAAPKLTAALASAIDGHLTPETWHLSARRKISKIFSPRLSRRPPNPIQDEKAVSIQYNCIILLQPKRWAELGASVRLTPRSARDVRKTPSLRASVGGGQISLTSVLIGVFVTCCCASSPYRPLLSVPAPSKFFSVLLCCPKGPVR